MNPIAQGLYISVVGIVVLFLVTVIFYFLLVGMQKLFPTKEEAVEETEGKVVKQTTTTSDDKATVAVIAVALHLAQSQVIPGLGDCLNDNRSAWWSSRLISAQKKSRPVKK